MKVTKMQKVVQNIQKFVENIQKFVQNVKLKLRTRNKNSKVQHILFEDFFKCDQIVNKLGYSLRANSDTKPSKMAKMNGILSQLTFILFLILFVTSFIISTQKRIFHTMLENILFIGIDVVLLVKVYTVFYKNRTKISKVIETLDKNFPHLEISQSTFQNHIKDSLKILKRFSKLFSFTCYAVVGHFLAMPFLHQIYGAFMLIDIKWEHVLTLNLLFDQYQPVVRELIFIVQTYLNVFGILFILCTDLIFGSLMQVLIMEFNILGQVMSEIDTIDPQEAITKMRTLLDIHQELIETSESLNEIFAPLQLVNAFCSIFALCTASFLAVVSYQWIVFIYYFWMPLINSQERSQEVLSQHS